MKVCAACEQDLPKTSFSKKQWQLKQHQRRCKDCIANDYHVPPQPVNNNDANEDAMPDDLLFITQQMSQMRGEGVPLPPTALPGAVARLAVAFARHRHNEMPLPPSVLPPGGPHPTF